MSSHRPRRRFAQNFLVDRGVIRSIIGLVRPKKGEVVVEIGPGRGALTNGLVAGLERLVAVEIDRDLAAMLHERLGAKGLHLIEGDILEVDLGQVLRDEGGDSLLIVGNLPYNITAPLIFHFLAQADHIDRAVIMVQSEVAQRLVARPGSKDYSLLSVLVGIRARRSRNAPAGGPPLLSSVTFRRFSLRRVALRRWSTFPGGGRGLFWPGGASSVRPAAQDVAQFAYGPQSGRWPGLA